MGNRRIRTKMIELSRTEVLYRSMKFGYFWLITEDGGGSAELLTLTEVKERFKIRNSTLDWLQGIR